MLEIKNKKIHTYINENVLDIEKIIHDYTNYINTIIRNAHTNLPLEDIEEIILDVYLTLWKNQDKLDINRNISSYISGITHNLIKKKYRTYKPSENLDDYENQFSDLSNVEIDYVEAEKNKQIIENLQKLKKEDQEIFIQFYYNEKSIKEIAQTLNMSETKVKAKLFRGRRKLKKYFNRKED